MRFDVFFSICQSVVDGYLPTEEQMFKNFFAQVDWADQLGFETAWLAETHLSCQVQKKNPEAVIPYFEGEIGLNTDVLQMAHLIFARTQKIEVGSAIRNILCNGGPVAHAEAVRTFLSLHGLNAREKRCLHLGFASGRFEFSNIPYGISPRNEIEKRAWPVVKGKILQEATEIFLRLLKGEVFSSSEVTPQYLVREDFRSEAEWKRVLEVSSDKNVFEQDRKFAISLQPRYHFDQVGLIPQESPLHLLKLILGSHDPYLQIKANQFLPVGVFNLSITPPEVIEQTHLRMEKHFHKDGGSWQRKYMPRTALIFIDETPHLSLDIKSKKAKEASQKAWQNYWRAMEGTLDLAKVQQAVDNTLSGHAEELAEKIRQRYHPEDRLMLWFDFNNHNNEEVMQSMAWFKDRVMPLLQ